MSSVKPTPSSLIGNVETISNDQLNRFSEMTSTMVSRIRDAVTAPEGKKTLRRFSIPEVSTYLDIPETTVRRKVESGEYPQGEVNPKNNYRTFDLREVIQMMEIEEVRPSFERGSIVTIANFKGGVSKTTLSAHFAQRQALRGYRVLVVDLDPQGSLSTMFGLVPDQDVDDDETSFPYLAGEQETLDYAIRPTYWPNIDLIPSNLQLYSADFLLPQRQQAEGAGFGFYAVLKKGLEQLRDRYDIIVIDTSPALSYLTTNALYAADGLIVPMPAAMLDFSSASQFLALLCETMNIFERHSGEAKSFAFMRFVITRYGNSEAEQTIHKWVRAAFGNTACPSVMAVTSAIQSSGPEMQSVYEVDQRHPDKSRRLDRRTYRRALEILEPLMDELNDVIVHTNPTLVHREDGK